MVTYHCYQVDSCGPSTSYIEGVCLRGLQITLLSNMFKPFRNLLWPFGRPRKSIGFLGLELGTKTCKTSDEKHTHHVKPQTYVSRVVHDSIPRTRSVQCSAKNGQSKNLQKLPARVT